MGNALATRKLAKVMKIDGHSFKLRAPVPAGEVVKDYPGHVLLDSEAVKHYGARARPLELHHHLRPRRLYFLVLLPPPPDEVRLPRRVRSGIDMTAKDRLEGLMLSRRSVSDLTLMNPKTLDAAAAAADGEPLDGVRRVRMALPKAEVARLVRESRDEADAAERIVRLCVSGSARAVGGGSAAGSRLPAPDGVAPSQKARLERRQRRVGFHPINEGNIQLSMGS